ncbi:MAG: hypothetical protein RMK29_20755 [Myxococcales bacterium]|nr:hypothetical protein [Myxococcota bacterium]MDW8284143.1 hypothetical protein [Myxococcales bacterium]
MIRKLFLAMAVLSPLAAAEPAMALRTNLTYRVDVEGLRVATMRLRNRVVDRRERCEYTAQISNLLGGPPLGRTVLCTLDEWKASNNFDCEANRRSFFDTLIQRSTRTTCSGFDDFGQQTRIDTLIAGEDSSGRVTGIFMSRSVGDVQTLEIRPL